jgi:hypothetical protein
MAGEATGTKKQRDQLRAALRDQGCAPEQIATEMGRQFGFRARQAWRHAHGWTQDDAAAAYNHHLGHDQAPMTGKRISDYEAWPHGGKKPTINALAMLAKVYSTEILNLVDLDDRHALSTQELITLDTHKTPPTAAAPTSPDTPPDNSTQNSTPAGECAEQPESTISITVHHNNHMPTEAILPTHHRRYLISILLLIITTAISGVVIVGKTMMADSRPATPAPASTPPVTGPVVPSAVISLPVLTPSPPPTPSSVSAASAPIPAAPIPRQRFTPIPTPTPAANTSPAQQTLLSPQTMHALPPAPVAQQTPPTHADPPPRPSQTPTAEPTSTLTTDVSWKNMYYNKCLDEQEPDITHDPANIQVWDCNNANNQIWTEKTIIANPTSTAKNLVSARTGRCVTYQPGDYSDHSKIWLTPCGKDGQGWIRIPTNNGYTFEAAEVRGMCMAATTGIVTESNPATSGYIGILLRRCDTSSTLKDWRAY